MSCKNSRKLDRRDAAGFFGLVAAGEPFRILFPLGTLIGIAGVSLWPMHVWGLLPVYPGTMHSRIMIQAFLGSFAAGFLCTALPRLLGAPRITLVETAGLAVSLAGVAACHLAGRTLAGDILFFCLICALLGLLAFRTLFRRDVPPPAFVLVPAGLLCALAGTGAFIAAVAAPGAVPLWLLPLGKLLLNQGFLLLPVMGIGAFLLPRFFGAETSQSFPESLSPPAGWMPRAALAAACGASVVGSFVWEAAGNTSAGCALRAAAAAVYFLCEIPLHRLGGGTLALSLRISLISIPTGYILMAIWPDNVFSLLHVVLITGFSLMALVVATRVILGHGGQAEKFHARIPAVLVTTGLIVLAMLTRVTADGMPAIRMSHYAYAAIAWIAGTLVWAVTILPGVRRASSDGMR